MWCVNRIIEVSEPVEEDVITMTSVTSSCIDANVSLDALYTVSLSQSVFTRLTPCKDKR